MGIEIKQNIEIICDMCREKLDEETDLFYCHNCILKYKTKIKELEKEIKRIKQKRY